MPFQITIDAHDPDRMAAFWALALGYEPAPPPEPHPTWRAWYLSVGVPAEELGEGDCNDRLRDPAGHGPPIWFQPVPETKTQKNRIHLDINVGGGRSVPVAERRPLVLAKVEDLLAVGATRLLERSSDADHFGVTMQDPEGNEFCVT